MAGNILPTERVGDNETSIMTTKRKPTPNKRLARPPPLPPSEGIQPEPDTLAGLCEKLVAVSDRQSRIRTAENIRRVMQEGIREGIAEAANAKSALPLAPVGGFGFATAGMYTLAPGVSRGDVQDQLNARLSQLRALLQLTCGGRAESFSSLNEDLQDGYHWACASMAWECEDLAKLL